MASTRAQLMALTLIATLSASPDPLFIIINYYIAVVFLLYTTITTKQKTNKTQQHHTQQQKYYTNNNNKARHLVTCRARVGLLVGAFAHSQE